MGVYWDNSSKGSKKGGVCEKTKYHNKWRVEIYVDGKRIRIGRFSCKDEAEKQFELAMLKHGRTPRKSKSK